MIFIVKSLVLFVLHPSFFHCHLYYSLYAPFFSLQTNVLFVNHVSDCESRQWFTKGPEIFFVFFFFLALVLFVQHPLFYHFFYRFHRKITCTIRSTPFFFSLQPVLFTLCLFFLFRQMYYLYKTHDFYHKITCTICSTPLFFHGKLYYSCYAFFFSLDRCTICIKPMIFIVKSLVLFTLHPFLFHSTDVLFAQYSWFLWKCIKIYQKI